jgi:hypothetical protein
MGDRSRQMLSRRPSICRPHFGDAHPRHSSISFDFSFQSLDKGVRTLDGSTIEREVCSECKAQALQAPAQDGAGSLTTGKLNAVRAVFKAGIKPSAIARQFGISQSDVRNALATEGRENAKALGGHRTAPGHRSRRRDRLTFAKAHARCGLTLEMAARSLPCVASAALKRWRNATSA